MVEVYEGSYMVIELKSYESLVIDFDLSRDDAIRIAKEKDSRIVVKHEYIGLA